MLRPQWALICQVERHYYLQIQAYGITTESKDSFYIHGEVPVIITVLKSII